MPRGTVKNYVPITLDDLATSVIADPAEVAKLAPPKRGYTAGERSPIQKQFDTYVEELHAFWESHDKPVPFTDAYPPRKVFVTPEQAPTVRQIATASGRFLTYGVRFGTDNPTTDGRVCVSFCAVDRQERKTKSKDE